MLVTGGAGFIGSNLADALVAAGYTTRVLDDLSAGYVDNVPAGAELVEGDVADEGLMRKVAEDVEVIFHLAAHRAVPRSIIDPLATDTANTHGTLTVLKVAADVGVRRVVYAGSSSVYGGAAQLPTPEMAPTVPRSPYAVSKLAAEHYCRVFSELHGLDTVVLRYFNVFGPRQRPDSAYAAVIPRFIEALRTGRPPVVEGDGLQTRDFTYVDDVVAANLAASASPAAVCRGHVYNIAGNRSFSLLDLLESLGRILGVTPQPTFADARPGDIRHSRADIAAAAAALGYKPMISFEEGLRRAVDWFSSDNSPG